MATARLTKKMPDEPVTVVGVVLHSPCYQWRSEVAHSPLKAITANGSPTGRAECPDCGVNGYVLPNTN